MFVTALLCSSYFMIFQLLNGLRRIFLLAKETDSHQERKLVQEGAQEASGPERRKQRGETLERSD